MNLLIISLLTLNLFVMVGCGSQDQSYYGAIHDDANLFSKAEKIKLQKTIDQICKYKSIFILIKSSKDIISYNDLPFYFDKQFEKQKSWHKTKNGFFSKIIGYFYWKLGYPYGKDDDIEIYILRNPSFIGIRYGSNTAWKAVTSGFMFLPDIMKDQIKAYNGYINKGVFDLIALFNNKYPLPSEISLYKRIVYNAFFLDIQNIIKNISVNKWKFYHNYLLRPIVKIQYYINSYLSWPIISFLLCILLVTIIINILHNIIKNKADKLIKNHKFKIIASIPFIISKWFLIIIPMIGSLYLLSSVRLEDHLFLAYLLEMKPNINYHLPPLFCMQTGLILATILAIIPSLKNVIDNIWVLPLSKIPKEAQRTIFEKIVMEDEKGNLDEEWEFTLKGAAFFLAFGQAYFLGQSYDNFDENRPFKSAIENIYVSSSSNFIKYSICFSCFPLALPIYLFLKDFIETVIKLPGNLNSYMMYKKIADISYNQFPVDK